MISRCLKKLAIAMVFENYSRILEGRSPGEPPKTLIDYFVRKFGKDGFLTFIDESHVTVPQLRGMYFGDRSRKDTLIDYGFRLPCARDNRPLTPDEFFARESVRSRFCLSYAWRLGAIC